MEGNTIERATKTEIDTITNKKQGVGKLVWVDVIDINCNTPTT